MYSHASVMYENPMGLFSRKRQPDTAALDGLRWQVLNVLMPAHDRIVDEQRGVVAGFLRSDAGVIVYVETPAERWYRQFRRWEEATPLWNDVRVFMRDVVGVKVSN
jgi:hypothetical protein